MGIVFATEESVVAFFGGGLLFCHIVIELCFINYNKARQKDDCVDIKELQIVAGKSRCLRVFDQYSINAELS